MKKETLWYLAIFIGISLFTIIVTSILFKSPSFLIFQQFVQANFAFFAVFLLFIKIIGIVWPPIPGGVVTLGAVTVLGWQWAFFIDLVGNTIGSLIAYYIARKYGVKVLVRLFGERMADRVSKIKLNRKHEFEATFLFCLAVGLVMIEVSSYAVGLLKVHPVRFLIANVLAHIVRNFPIFFFFDTALGRGNGLGGIVMIVVLILVVIVGKKRYPYYVKIEEPNG